VPLFIVPGALLDSGTQGINFHMGNGAAALCFLGLGVYLMVRFALALYSGVIGAGKGKVVYYHRETEPYLYWFWTVFNLCASIASFVCAIRMST
jgi:hypothetical protein